MEIRAVKYLLSDYMIKLAYRLRSYMRVVLILLLVQFTIPAFVSYAAQDDNATLQEKAISIEIEHRFILLPVLLNEQEEDKREGNTQYDFITQPILDFSDHSLALIESHQLKYTPAPSSQQQQSSLVTLFCHYTI